MSKKDYEAIAKIINNQLKSGGGIISLTIELADYFAIRNDLFIRTEFLEACGVRRKLST